MTTFLDPNDARLTAFALGELDSADRIEMETLLAASPELQAELAEITNLAGMLRADLATEPVPVLTTVQRQELTQPTTTVATTHLTNHTELVALRRFRDRRWRMSVAGIAIAVGVTAMMVIPRSMGRFSGDSTSSLRSWFGDIAICDVSPDEGSVFVRNSPDRSSSIETASVEALADSEMTFSQSSRSIANQSDPLAGRYGYYDADQSVSRDEGAAPGHVASATFSGSTGDGVNENRNTPAAVTGPRTVNGGAIRFDLSATGRMIPLDKSVNDGIHPGTLQVDAARLPAPSPKFVSGPVTAHDNAPETNSRARLLGRFAKDNEAKPGAAPVAAYYEVDRQKDSYAIERAPQPGSPESKDNSQGNEKYDTIIENVFQTPSQQPLSTFSIDVDSASYSNVRRFLAQGQLPPPDAVRIEEMINYFNYSYPQPKDGEPFSVTADAAPCPWQRDHYLARIALQARTIDKAKRPPTNLVFLLDVSGSMQAANKLPLVKQAMTMLCEELNERDRIAIVTYAGDAGIKLTSTPGSNQVRIMQVIESLQAGGSTNRAAGINVAYEEALKNFNGEGENRVILCTDGDFNVGVSDDEQLVQLIQQQARSKVFLSIFGFGMGNLKDAKLEKLADKGNGHYGYIDDLKEARRVFNEELVGTLYTVAKDVKIQVEFNPLTVGAYRLIGYENRALAAKDFNDDTKDAGEIGAGHAVTALYEIVPKGLWPKTQPVDPLKYASAGKEPTLPIDSPKLNIPADAADDLFTVKLRYKQPTADTSVKTIDYVVDDIAGKKIVPSADFLWAASVASFGMQLKQSQFKGQWTLNDLHETAQAAKGPDVNGRRREFLDLVQAAKRLK